MLEIGMLDLGLLMGEGELAGEVVALLAASPKISEFIKRSPLQGKLLKKRLQSWGEQLGEEPPQVLLVVDDEDARFQQRRGGMRRRHDVFLPLAPPP